MEDSFHQLRTWGTQFQQRTLVSRDPSADAWIIGGENVFNPCPEREGLCVELHSLPHQTQPHPCLVPGSARMIRRAHLVAGTHRQDNGGWAKKICCDAGFLVHSGTQYRETFERIVFVGQPLADIFLQQNATQHLHRFCQRAEVVTWRAWLPFCGVRIATALSSAMSRRKPPETFTLVVGTRPSQPSRWVGW
ncbi:hypothetical protein VTI28DRAFT_7886 [Corynascus sepedonium]